MLVEASQARVSRKRVVMDNETEDPDDPNSGWHSTRDDDREKSNGDARQFEDDEAAMRDMDGEAGPSTSTRRNGHGPQTARELREEEEDEDVMEAIATQSAALAPHADNSRMDLDNDGDSDDELTAVDGDDGDQRGSGESGERGEPIRMARPPPVFGAVNFDQDEVLRRSVAKRLKKGHEPVLEELPKWSLLAKVLKEIEDTMERLKISHAGKLSPS
jgi:DNA excision repair protein ERCC-4